MTELINLPQLEIEIKFYLGQTAQNIIEVGKRLIQAKSLVNHGHWQHWLELNFQLSHSTAKNFMACAERFGESQSIGFLKSTQMIQLLALPDAAETEKFIAEKAAEGKKVDEMTIKQLREEIAEYKKIPTLTLQAYLSTDGAELLQMALVSTIDLFDFIQKFPSQSKHTGENQHGQASFIVVKWDDFKRKYTLMTIKPEVEPNCWLIEWQGSKKIIRS